MSDEHQRIAKEILDQIAMENREMTAFDVALYGKRTNRKDLVNTPAGFDQLKQELVAAPIKPELDALAWRHRGERHG